jgi:hypothetical protein
MPLATLIPAALLLDHLLRITMLPSSSIGPSVVDVLLRRCTRTTHGSGSRPNVGLDVVARGGHDDRENCPSKNTEAGEEFRFVPLGERTT